MSSQMTISYPIFLLCIVSSLSYTIISECNYCYMHQNSIQSNRKFEQKTNRFWEFKEQSNTWVEVKLPYDLVSCINDNCKVVNSIQESSNKTPDQENKEKSFYSLLRVRKRISMTRMSETSIWVTGESGSIYERYWNGLQWVIAPHDLPVSAGYAVSVFIVNHTILALSESGLLYQMQLTEDSLPFWVEFVPVFDRENGKETEQSSNIQLSSGVISNDRERMYFCTKNGSLVELHSVDPPMWINHGRPPGANVVAITDAGTIRPAVLFTLSAAGVLYEYDQASKPPWKKHIHIEGSEKDNSLAPIKGCTLHGLIGAHSSSLFLLTKEGELVERRLNQRKWRWVVHGNPKDHLLTSIACVSQDELNENPNSLFLTTATGFVFEYQIPKYEDQETEKNWLNHKHPPHAKIARGIPGLQIHVGRMIFPLDDGRLAELHLSGFGGENLGPYISTKRKSLLKYVWSILEAPETEGWNAEYCTDERGPSNCILGSKDETIEVANTRSTSKWRKDRKTQENYLSFDASYPGLSNSGEEYWIPEKWINTHFRLRLMQEGKSFFLVTSNGVTFEYLNTENVWFWLRHEHSTAMEGALGNYNGSLFLVDENGSLLIRERSGSDLAWINCTSMRRGRHVIGGPPWDSVTMRKFKWKDCKNPPSTKIACIVDQEGFRDNIVFVIGRNGRLYQYNKVNELWHEHYQSQHLVLSRSPGTAMRSSGVIKGSIFMISEDGGLVEYQMSSSDGWNWIEHGTPYTNVTLVGAPGPCFNEAELFLIGSDGNVYLRFLDQGEWQWRDYGFPYMGFHEREKQAESKCGKEETCTDKGSHSSFDKFEEKFPDINKNCNPKVVSTRPIPFSEDLVIFELGDGRLGEMRRMEDKYWIWSRTIGTPTSLCMANFWTSLAS
ncbi:hypothetical protein ACJIZ3_012027 [Penstemon smallii]|uniref:Uncharacterized protein n=1 Tax=Penstemon smallii TaxID=265156 RepID=A0ABD3UL65_9LAMI